MIGKIAVSAANFAIDKPYSYRIPPQMQLQPGQRVMVPFGRGNKRCEGVVLAIEPDNTDPLKAVEQCLDPEPLLSETQLRLAAFLRERYFCTFYDAIRAMLPAGIWFESRQSLSLDPEPLLSETQLRLAAFLRERYFCTFYDAIRAMLPAGIWFESRQSLSLSEDRSWKQAQIRKEGARELLEFLEELGGQAEEKDLSQRFPEEDVLAQLVSYLTKKKWVQAQVDFQRRLSDKTEKIALLAVPAEEAMDFAAHRSASAVMQRRVLELMCTVGRVSVKELCYFTGATTATVKRLEKLGYLTLEEQPVLRCREIRPAKLDGPLVLNEQQQACYESLKAQMEQPAPGVALLHGVTGSGKTSVYIRLIQSCLDAGRAAMLLVPEIALTPQLLGLMAAYFGQQTAVLHSSLGPAERYDQW